MIWAEEVGPTTHRVEASVSTTKRSKTSIPASNRSSAICLAGTEEDGIPWTVERSVAGSGHSKGRLEASGLRECLLTVTLERGAHLVGSRGVDYIVGVGGITRGDRVLQAVSQGEGGEVSRAAAVRHVAKSSEFS